MFEGPTVCQPSGWSGGRAFQPPAALVSLCGGTSLPLRPVWPSWMPATPPNRLIIAVTRAWPSIWSSSQMPAQEVVVRPSGVMAICSGKTSPKPPAARAPRYMTW